ncbi:Non-repetitive/WGA-negative nucleoporin C-terminal-domain-containing protein [Sphaerosporella brunnea]|uniref:Non-repetitive/WGA-negative nucleoporin C-terminal-domain-containing protein n=1 Tax=Sphaerosporella brunnea TaxID=1250544 RepID=A0A5J5ET55_9PEZI|nr:Non-repetitive/WGA-negative nucleoporin C-terminal-domain-containing protein [Sphaerosporella brunnea]
MFGAQTSSASTGYPDLPPELQSTSSSFQTPERLRPQQQQQQVVRAAPKPITDSMTPVQRAARTILETLESEKRYPQLDDIVAQGQSQEYEMCENYAWEPFVQTNNHTIPDAIFEQYNRSTSHTQLGLFPEIKQAWITVDNRLYMWDYATQTGFQGYEQQPNAITAVKLLKPKPGVFENVNYVLVVATVVEVFLLGVHAHPNARGVMEVMLYETKMSIPAKGLDIHIIEGSKKTGRIFFGGKTDNELYELTYQAEERWFQGRCQKMCHTSTGVSAFAPRLPLWAAGQQEVEYMQQMVVDDTRNLLYTLSSKSTIRVFHIRSDGSLGHTLSHSFSHTLANIRVMIGSTPMLGPDTPIVSISAVSSLQARRTHLIAVTKSGCRLFMSAVSSEYGFGGTDAAPTSMQVIHIRYPPHGHVNNNVRKAKVITPGYFFCAVERNSEMDDMIMAAPDAAKIQALHDAGNTRLHLVEQASVFQPERARIEVIEVIGGQFAAQRSPPGFGNELATQFDIPSTEIAVLTNGGVQVLKRRRLVEVFDAILRYGSTASPIGVDGEARKFFETYGRAEGCASALAVACGAVDNIGFQPPAVRISDVEIQDLARKYYIEYGGKPRADNVYDASTLPSLDSIKVSARAEGLQLYVARIVRSIWKAWIISESRTPGGGLEYVSSVPTEKLRTIQEQLLRLDNFLRTNRSFIVGLSGADSLLVAGSKIEEVANQAEHRMLHSLHALIGSMIEGISFVLFLFGDRLTDIVLSLDQHNRELLGTMTYGQLFASEQGQALGKELVTAIVNRNIAAGVSVDTIADALRRRCGSFCSADDVVVFKALEQVKRAKTETDPDTKNRLLRESLRLFEETAASLTVDNLADMVAQFVELEYYPGAVQLALAVAREIDRGNLARLFLTEPPTVESEMAQLYHKRIQCYQLIFKVLEALDVASARSPEMIDGVQTPITRLRNETWSLIYTSEDELFHYQLYDWLYNKGGVYRNRLLDINSQYILGYLTYRGAESLEHCDLLWNYHQKRGRHFEAAEVLHELALSNFDLDLARRLEYFSLARSCCQAASGTSRRRINELNQTIQEEIDVAMIQDDLLKRIREDQRITEGRKKILEKKLNGKIVDLSDLFNNYASPYSYHDICLAIFLAAEYKVVADIRRCWEQLITQKHMEAEQLDEGVQPWELVADEMRRLGQRYVHSEYIFPTQDLIPLLEVYAYEHQRNRGPPGWVVDIFLDAGVSEDRVLRVLDEMFWRNEIPFQGIARRRLLFDATLVAEKWWTKVVKRGAAEGFRPDAVASMLRNMANEIPQAIPEIERVNMLLADMDRRGL